ncbi:MAG: YtxH domain-containing protein [Flavobacteriales bacterium]
MSGKLILTALVTGVALGAIAGVMLAPDSGENTRKKFKEKGGNVFDLLHNILEQGKAMMGEADEALKDAGRNAARSGRDTMAR